jgi:hypothetical protein
MTAMGKLVLIFLKDSAVKALSQEFSGSEALG